MNPVLGTYEGGLASLPLKLILHIVKSEIVTDAWLILSLAGGVHVMKW